MKLIELIFDENYSEDFADNDISSSLTNILSLSHLKYLCLRRNSFLPKHMNAFQNITKNIVSLNLNSNRILDEGVKILVENILKYNEDMKSLELQ